LKKIRIEENKYLFFFQFNMNQLQVTKLDLEVASGILERINSMCVGERR